MHGRYSEQIGRGRRKGHCRIQDDWSALPGERMDGCVLVAKTTKLKGSLRGPRALWDALALHDVVNGSSPTYKYNMSSLTQDVFGTQVTHPSL